MDLNMLLVEAPPAWESPPASNCQTATRPFPVDARNTRWTCPDEDIVDQQIFIVDDEELNVRVAKKYLRTWGFERVGSTTDSVDAIERIHHERPDLILLDVMMPDISGLDILRELRRDKATRHLPVIILTAHSEDEVKREALDLGANDFLGKPIDPHELQPRVRNLLALRAHQNCLERTSEYLEAEVQRRTAALVRAELHVVNCLARAAEYRDNETGRHIIRVGRYASLIAEALGCDSEFVKLILEAAKLHDVGKIGIPDAILFKTGKLDPDEFEQMREHCSLGLNVLEQITRDDFHLFRRHVQMGASILNAVESPLLAMASQIAMTHHEKWDGSGYPFGLVGEQIPLEGRITAVADVFDALSSQRPYKPAFPLEKCYAILMDGRGSHFDPRVLDAFLHHRDEAIAIQRQYADP